MVRIPFSYTACFLPCKTTGQLSSVATAGMIPRFDGGTEGAACLNGPRDAVLAQELMMLGWNVPYATNSCGADTALPSARYG